MHVRITQNKNYINVYHSSEILIIKKKKTKSLHTLCSAIACLGYSCKEIENDRFRNGAI